MLHPKQQAEQERARKLLEDQAAVRRILSDPAARALFSSFQGQDTAQLQAAARSALQGDPQALSGILQRISSDPRTSGAMEQLMHSMEDL